jgi:elongation factor Ts
MGKTLSIKRFTRFEMGEGLEKRNDDFAAEVEAQMKK